MTNNFCRGDVVRALRTYTSRGVNRGDQFVVDEIAGKYVNLRGHCYTHPATDFELVEPEEEAP